MNPLTNRFEQLYATNLDMTQGPDEFDREFYQGLVRPDGSPVPKAWTVLSIDEMVEIKGYTFKVAHIGEGHLLLEPVSPDDIADILERKK